MAMGMGGGQVVVVEGDTLRRTMLLDALRREGHYVSGAGCAEEALEIFRSGCHEAAVIDVTLPGRSGLWLLRELESSGSRVEAVVTAFRATLEMAIESMQLGAVNLLEHSAPSASVAEWVAKAIERARETRRADIRALGDTLLESVPRGVLPVKVVTTVCDALDAEESTLMVPGEDGRLRVAASTSMSPELQAIVRLDLGERIAGKVALDASPAFLSERVDEDPRFAGEHGHGRVASSIVYPLVHQGRLQGVLTIGRKRGSNPFIQIDLDYAEELSRAASRALNEHGYEPLPAGHELRKAAANDRRSRRA